ncbi:MAG: hypothetical protein US71_C0011G0029 [Parcubacteria group bacterium GW2011_GWD2_38_12]|nr:MAG: hypothetical protein US06_C0006G0034 [Parcubacteria group bacterium GW2011_GWC2_36_17]KKQ41454.1 MAG: hypothetical protein US61_C0048G0003 [Parcubacteria group bacterium GW2011_GWE2_37_8]KKQ51473.1 MAG: hypothetical protein US71_C0011G0029 [Parcubacteria group bacterium GW2011_GWD2_38_12]KKQ58702.1 MAG: hypothetical protein US79_C0003G0003 [Parcubacteria group bacterium GW2011_GWC1_38_17]KKQ59296.1 MAG: hypothetical protein US78_C0006G0003 [Parcubacteria group bacterium GW2011_GWD1_38_1
MIKLTPQIKLYITIAIIIMILIALIFGAILPILGKINFLKEEYLSIKLQIVNTKERRSQVEKVEKEFEVIKDSIAKIDVALVDPSKFLDVIIKLEQLAEKTGNKHEITIIEIPKSQKDSKEKESSLFKNIPFKVILRGTFENAMSFMNELENAQFYSKIEKVEMIKIEKPAQEDLKNNGLQEGDIKTTLNVKIYAK